MPTLSPRGRHLCSLLLAATYPTSRGSGNRDIQEEELYKDMWILKYCMYVYYHERKISIYIYIYICIWSRRGRAHLMTHTQWRCQPASSGLFIVQQLSVFKITPPRFQLGRRVIALALVQTAVLFRDALTFQIPPSSFISCTWNLLVPRLTSGDRDGGHLCFYTGHMIVELKLHLTTRHEWLNGKDKFNLNICTPITKKHKLSKGQSISRLKETSELWGYILLF